MALKLLNNARSRLAGGLSAIATTVTVQVGHGSRFPTLSPGDWFPLAVENASGEIEYMRCTGRAGDVLTVARAQEGSVARGYSAGDPVELRLTAAAFIDYIVQETALATTAASILTKLLTVHGSGCGLDADLVDGLHGTDMLRRHVDFWQTSLDGIQRLFFQNGGQTYFGSGSGWSFQRGTVDRAWIDANGVLFLRGAIARISDDPNLILFLSGNTAVLGVDQDDFYFYDRVNDGHNFAIGSVTRFYVSSDGYGNAQVGFRAGGNVVWHPGNDGAGSGLDTDLWRGKTPAQHIAEYFTSGSNANGHWSMRPDGNGGFIVEQWGITPSVGEFSHQTITFPIQFPTACENVQITPRNDVDSDGDESDETYWVSNVTQNDFIARVNGDWADATYFWRAIGR